uniref:VPS9 domain-containing protein n=1 Tax=Elaeophora elaphi TaxID=1147741 RepID=A0A0R3RVD5_9BILA
MKRVIIIMIIYALQCVSQFAPAGDRHVWTTDDLLPAFVYVTVRAQLQHLGAEIRLIEDFTPQLQGSGQIELMFTTLRASYFQICSDKNLP